MSDFGYQHGRCQKERPPAPQAWIRTRFGTPPVEMIWHHVIPFAVLRDCWNTLAKHQRKSPKAAVSLQIYMRLLGFENTQAKTLIKAMAAGTLGQAAQERIETVVAYPPWDIVEGPAKRADDPDDDFDEYSAGLSFTEQNRHEKLRSLFHSLKVFNHATGSIVDIDDRVFAGMANQMFLIERNLQGSRQIIPFRESMWQTIQPPGQDPPLPAIAIWKKKRLRSPGTA